MSSITIKELARELNLSAATVSRALSDSYEISAQPNKRFWQVLYGATKAKRWL